MPPSRNIDDELPDSSSDDEEQARVKVPPVKNLPRGGEGASEPLLGPAAAPSDAMRSPRSKPTTPREKFISKSKQSTPRDTDAAAALASAVPDAEQAKKAAEEAKAVAGAAASELSNVRTLTKEEQAALAEQAKADAAAAVAAAKKLWEDMMNDRPPPCWPLPDVSKRMAKYVDLLFDTLPENIQAKIPAAVQPHLKPGLLMAIKIMIATSGWFAFIFRWGYRIWTMLPKNFAQMIFGLALCYFGGTYVMTIAAAEAFRTMGAERAINDVRAMAGEISTVLEANDRDDAEDLDGDGVADVDDLTPPQLLQRKALLVAISVKNPEKIQQAAASLYAALLAVVATLRLEFAQTVAMAIGVADMAKKPLVNGVKPIALRTLPPTTHQWIVPGIESGLQLFAIMVAIFIQQIISAFYSALRGGKLFASACFNVVHDYAKKGVILCPGVVGADYDPDNSVLDEIIGWAIAAQGFWFQLSTGFSVPFPFNVLLLPLSMLEWYLKLQVVAGGGGSGRRMGDLSEMCAFANCTCPVVSSEALGGMGALGQM